MDELRRRLQIFGQRSAAIPQGLSAWWLLRNVVTIGLVHPFAALGEGRGFARAPAWRATIGPPLSLARLTTSLRCIRPATHRPIKPKIPKRAVAAIPVHCTNVAPGNIRK
jgi:hypothetical protein